MKVKRPFALRMLFLPSQYHMPWAWGQPQPCDWAPADAWWSQKAACLLDPVSLKDFTGKMWIEVSQSLQLGGIHQPGASSRRVQPFRLCWEMLQVLQELMS